MIYGVNNFTIDKIIDSLSNLPNVLIKHIGYNQNPSRESLQRKIFVDEFIAVIEGDNSRNFERAKEIILSAQSVQNTTKYEASISQPKIDLSTLPSSSTTTQHQELDSSKVLDKLHSILKELAESKVMSKDSCNINFKLLATSPEEEGITTLPLLKIFKSYDRTNAGLLELTKFKEILIECFPVLSYGEILVLTSIAEKVSLAQNSQLANKKTDIKLISYYHFLMQIEKYFALKLANGK